MVKNYGKQRQVLRTTKIAILAISIEKKFAKNFMLIVDCYLKRLHRHRDRGMLDFIHPSRLVCIPVFKSFKERSRECGESCE